METAQQILDRIGPEREKALRELLTDYHYFTGRPGRLLTTYLGEKVKALQILFPDPCPPTPYVRGVPADETATHVSGEPLTFRFPCPQCEGEGEVAKGKKCEKCGGSGEKVIELSTDYNDAAAYSGYMVGKKCGGRIEWKALAEGADLLKAMEEIKKLQGYFYEITVGLNELRRDHGLAPVKPGDLAEVMTHAMAEGAELWKQEYDECRKHLDAVLTVFHVPGYVPSEDRQKVVAAQKFLKEYQHFTP